MKIFDQGALLKISVNLWQIPLFKNHGPISYLITVKMLLYAEHC